MPRVGDNYCNWVERLALFTLPPDAPRQHWIESRAALRYFRKLADEVDRNGGSGTVNYPRAQHQIDAVSRHEQQLPMGTGPGTYLGSDRPPAKPGPETLVQQTRAGLEQLLNQPELPSLNRKVAEFALQQPYGAAILRPDRSSQHAMHASRAVDLCLAITYADHAIAQGAEFGLVHDLMISQWLVHAGHGWAGPFHPWTVPHAPAALVEWVELELGLRELAPAPATGLTPAQLLVLMAKSAQEFQRMIDEDRSGRD